MKLTSPLFRSGAALFAAALALSACGSDNNSGASGADANIQCATGSVSGAGSTFAATIVQQWRSNYSNSCPGASINYQAVGSGAGIQQLTAGTVDFAGSDVPLKPEEEKAAEAKQGDVVHVPWSAGAIAVEYNLPEAPNLQLRPATLAGIFNGTHKTWNDPVIAADNPGVTLPATPIQVVHRSDGSGTTAAFTSYLEAAAPDVWKAGSGKDISWPTGQGAKGSDGVTGAVKQTAGAISYAELSYPKLGKLGIAKIGNPTGAFVAPDAENAVTAALADAKVPDNLQLDLDYTPQNPAAYPISTVTYAVVPTKPGDAGKAKLMQSFLRYALGDGQKAAPELFYAPLPAELTAPALEAVNRIQTGG